LLGKSVLNSMKILKSLNLSLFVGVAAISMASVANAAVLLHEYTFSGPGVTDSVGGVHGTLENGATISGGVLSLDGVNDYAQIGGKLIPSGLNAFSVTLDAQQLSTQTGFRELISQGVTSGPGFYIGEHANGNIRVTDQFGGIGVSFPTDGGFHSYALTSGALGTNLYLDGILIFSDAAQLSMTGAGTDTRFGSQFGAIGEFFHGNLDNIRIYDGVLTESEVQALAQVSEPGALLVFGFGLAGLGYMRRRKAS